MSILDALSLGLSGATASPDVAGQFVTSRKEHFQPEQSLLVDRVALSSESRSRHEVVAIECVKRGFSIGNASQYGGDFLLYAGLSH